MVVSRWAALAGLLLGIAVPQASEPVQSDRAGDDAPPGKAPAGPAQFDFLVGEWDTVAVRHAPDPSQSQELPGRWRARHLLGGAMVLDEYTRLTPAGDVLGGSATLRQYLESTGRWEMVFLDTERPQVLDDFTGEWRDGEMKLSGAGPVGLFRGRFHEIRPESFRWEGELSSDGGKTWQLLLTIEARRRS